MACEVMHTWQCEVMHLAHMAPGAHAHMACVVACEVLHSWHCEVSCTQGMRYWLLHTWRVRRVHSTSEAHVWRVATVLFLPSAHSSVGLTCVRSVTMSHLSSHFSVLFSFHHSMQRTAERWPWNPNVMQATAMLGQGWKWR